MYSRTNFHWLGLLLEQVTGTSYGDLVAGLAREFGLQHTSLDPAARPGWVGYASGGVASTVSDLARWGSLLFTPGRVVAADQLALLTTIGGGDEARPLAALSVPQRRRRQEGLRCHRSSRGPRWDPVLPQ